MSESLFTPIAYLKGIGPQKAELLKKELQIETYWDLLNHFPFRYVDRSKIQQCDQLHLVEGYIQLEGFIDQIQELGGGRAKRLQCRFTDDTGSIQLVWFQGWKWIKQTLILGKKYRVFGRPRLNGNFWSIAHPELAPTETASSIGYQPIYPSTEKLSAKGLHTRGLEHVIKGLLERISLENIPDRLPESLRKAMQLVGIDSAYRNMHQPTEEQGFTQAKKRFVFEELFLLQLEMILRKGVRKRSEKGFVFSKSGDNLANFYHNKLPFDLTEAQKRVVREIRKDMQTGQHMNRLLQGDVGSGKTLVALITMLIAQGNGFQSALLAPTEILSAQHYETIVSFLADLPIRCALLTGSVKRSQRKPLLESLANGEIDLLIGTHGLLGDEAG